MNNPERLLWAAAAISACVVGASLGYSLRECPEATTETGQVYLAYCAHGPKEYIHVASTPCLPDLFPCRGTDAYMCPTCGECFQHEAVRAYHEQHDHPTEFCVKCGVCHKRLGLREAYDCTLCGARFCNSTHRRSHLEGFHLATTINLDE